jgi:hypothetical protein
MRLCGFSDLIDVTSLSLQVIHMLRKFKKFCKSSIDELTSNKRKLVIKMETDESTAAV